MSRYLILLGLTFVVVGAAWPLFARLGLGRLPGDVAIKTQHGGFYFPIVSGLVVSVVLSLIFWFIRRL